MTGAGTTAVYRLSAVLIWALAIWHSWLARGLFVDGSAALLYMMQNGGYALFYDSRQTLIAVTQTPAAIALELGVTDTHLLARLLSAGLFFLPTAYYHACLFRARHDPALLGAVLLTIGVVFLPTSFLILGEYNTIHAAVLFAVLVLATTTRPTAGDGVLLIVTAAVLMRSYETMLAFGPLVAGMIGWRLRLSGRRDIGSLLHGLAGLLFLAAAGFSLQSLLGPHVPGHMRETLTGMSLFWTNVQFILPLAALMIVAIAGLVDPRLLESRRLYLFAGILLALVALSPLLWIGDGTMRPLPKSHYHSRMVAGMVTAAIVIAVWLYALRPAQATGLPRALTVLSRPSDGRRLMLFGVAAVLAALPADIYLSDLWRRSLVEFQATIAARSGSIPVAETALGRAPYSHLVEEWALSSESLVLRRNAGDGIVVPPPDFPFWQFYDVTKPWLTNVGRFRWDGGS